MPEIMELTRFFQAIQNNPKIGASHISLYMALFQLYNLNGFKNPIMACRKKVMELAKISGTATFHKCIKDLTAFGYINYCPSYNASILTEINLVKL